MVERVYLVEGKEVKVLVYVMQTSPPQIVIEIQAGELVNNYVDENGTISFALNIDDLFDAIREALSPSQLVRD